MSRTVRFRGKAPSWFGQIKKPLAGTMGSDRTIERQYRQVPMKAIAFDWGHTLIDERRDEHIPLDTRPVYVMPGVVEVVPRLTLPLAVWANTRVASEAAVRRWLDRAGLGP